MIDHVHPGRGQRSESHVSISDDVPSYSGHVTSRVVEFAQTEFTAVGRYDAAFSAGPGCLMEDDPEPLGYHLIEANWLRSVTSAAPEQLSIVRVDGDSMERTLNHGDWILVDMAKRQFSKEGIYALNVFGQTWVKRLSINISKKLIRIMSDNDKYEIQELPEHEIVIIGRVVSIVARRLF
jgi:phage repressor protein C with HTH and peptisase S24 domain